MRLLIEEFGGMVPVVEDSKLPSKSASKAVNCRFDSGSLQPYAGLFDETAVITANVSSIFLYDDTHWFSWISDVDVVNSLINNDAYNRVYYTGNGYPRVTDNSIATGASTMPAADYRMGVKQPPVPGISAINNNTDDADSSNDITRFYVMTYVNGYGEESMPSSTSDEVTLLNVDATVSLAFASIAGNDQNITHRRLYRTNGANYQLVVELPIANTTYTDDKSDNELSIVLDSWSYVEPLISMKGLTAMANGIMAGFDDFTICFSEAFLPHAWPIEYQQTTQFKIVSMVAVGSSVAVGTTGNPYLFSGVSPDAISGQKLELAQACVSKQSMVDMGEYAIYASPDGLVAIGPSVAKLITEPLFNKKEWQSYSPETIRAAHYEGKYVAFYNNSRGFVFDPRNGDFIELDFFSRAIHSDLKSDKLYLTEGTQLKSFDESSTNLSYEWSKSVRLNQRALPACCFIDTTEPENIGLIINVDGVEVLNYASLAIPDINQSDDIAPVIRLPSLRGREFDFTLSGTGTVHRIAFASNMKDAQHG